MPKEQNDKTPLVQIDGETLHAYLEERVARLLFVKIAAAVTIVASIVGTAVGWFTKEMINNKIDQKVSALQSAVENKAALLQVDITTNMTSYKNDVDMRLLALRNDVSSNSLSLGPSLDAKVRTEMKAGLKDQLSTLLLETAIYKDAVEKRVQSAVASNGGEISRLAEQTVTKSAPTIIAPIAKDYVDRIAKEQVTQAGREYMSSTNMIVEIKKLLNESNVTEVVRNIVLKETNVRKELSSQFLTVALNPKQDDGQRLLALKEFVLFNPDLKDNRESLLNVIRGDFDSTEEMRIQALAFCGSDDTDVLKIILLSLEKEKGLEKNRELQKAYAAAIARFGINAVGQIEQRLKVQMTSFDTKVVFNALVGIPAPESLNLLLKKLAESKDAEPEGLLQALGHFKIEGIEAKIRQNAALSIWKHVQPTLAKKVTAKKQPISASSVTSRYSYSDRNYDGDLDLHEMKLEDLTPRLDGTYFEARDVMGISFIERYPNAWLQLFTLRRFLFGNDWEFVNDQLWPKDAGEQDASEAFCEVWYSVIKDKRASADSELDRIMSSQLLDKSTAISNWVARPTCRKIVTWALQSCSDQALEDFFRRLPQYYGIFQETYGSIIENRQVAYMDIYDDYFLSDRLSAVITQAVEHDQKSIPRFRNTRSLITNLRSSTPRDWKFTAALTRCLKPALQGGDDLCGEFLYDCIADDLQMDRPRWDAAKNAIVALRDVPMNGQKETSERLIKTLLNLKDVSGSSELHSHIIAIESTLTSFCEKSPMKILPQVYGALDRLVQEQKKGPPPEKAYAMSEARSHLRNVLGRFNVVSAVPLYYPEIIYAMEENDRRDAQFALLKIARVLKVKGVPDAPSGVPDLRSIEIQKAQFDAWEKWWTSVKSLPAVQEFKNNYSF